MTEDAKLRETWDEAMARFEIPLEEAKKLIDGDGRTVIIDIRNNADISLGYIKGARFVALGLIEGESNKLSADREAPVLVYCASGARSVMAAEKLQKMGFVNARSIAGGFDAWLDAGWDIVSDGRLTVHQLNRYSRNMFLPEVGEEGQLKLLDAKVLIVGAGGLGSPAALYLAAAGVGTLGIVDFDHVDLSNLNRQVIHGTGDIARPKADSAADSIKRINPDVKVNAIHQRLTPYNALSVIGGYDVVMDATDSIETKFLLNDACWFAEKPYVFGGATGFDGQASVFWPKKEGPCLRCIFPKPPPRVNVPTCSEVGVLGVVPGQIGLVQATEILKLVLGIGTPMIGKYYIYNALDLKARFIETGKNASCPLCGADPQIRALTGEGSAEYETFVCGGK